MFHECYDKNGNYIGRTTSEEGAKNLILQANRLIDQKEEAERLKREILLQQEAKRQRKQQKKACRINFIKSYYKHFLAILATITALVLLILPSALHGDIYGPNTTYFDTVKRVFYWVTPEFVIPDHATKISYEAFVNCDRLISVTIPDSVTSIECRAFSVCSNLTSVTIGNGVTLIEMEAFWNSYSLKSVTIGKSVREIEQGVFYNCPLKSVYCKAIIPPAIFGARYWYGAEVDKVFSDTNDLKIFVPREAYCEYKRTKACWGDYERYKSLSQDNWDFYYRNIEPYDFEMKK